MTASIFFTAPKLELAYQMASNPIQMRESDCFSSVDNAYVLSGRHAAETNSPDSSMIKKDRVCAVGFIAHNFRR
jgi:hypothetical protein